MDTAGTQGTHYVPLHWAILVGLDFASRALFVDLDIFHKLHNPLILLVKTSIGAKCKINLTKKDWLYAANNIYIEK